MESSFAPEAIFHLGTFPVTNTLLSSLLVDALLIIAALYISRHLKTIPGLFQNLTELLIDTFYSLTETIAGKRAGIIFPFFMTFFLFIIVTNWTGLLPGVGTIGIREEGKLIPYIRAATSDVNTTLALAIVSVIATHILAIRSTGIKDYLSRYFSFNPVFLFVGILEIVSEITKLVSLSFRLFGNIFAGEVVLSTVSSMFAFLLPLPFLMLEIIVGLVQALVFAMLTMAFMAILTTPHHAEEGASH